ncbi:uncharacterized protein LOC112519608 [Cynara cardunculus var. scolymus]|uniref:uncharacterized protein LOC112519608 n=1 Tax=Cynara cardunculus var. scolymus TaxID=59895 RepID=UPI000D6235E9|nr:uncharacterized protein LOC112519608 [Cynara cardunculus var. scolymus]
MGRSSNSSQALLDLENSTQNSSSKESALLVCKRGDEDLLKKLEAAKTKANGPPDSKPAIAAPPPSQVMGKVRDFLGVMAESNKKLQLDAMNSKNYDIEALTGDESEYIEMDLMLGVADLHTPAAVAAAESAIVGSQPVISLDASSSDSESEDSSDDDNDDDDDDSNDETNEGKCKTLDDKPTKAMSENGQRRKRPKIIELM